MSDEHFKKITLNSPLKVIEIVKENLKTTKIIYEDCQSNLHLYNVQDNTNQIIKKGVNFIMNKTFGAYIKNLRHSKNLTEEFVAEKLNISPQKYAKIEADEERINLNLLLNIATVFEIKVEDVVNILNKSHEITNQTIDKTESSNIPLEMLELFYANKNLYEKITEFKK